MTVDEAIRDLLSISTDLRAVAVVAADGTLLGAGPGAVSSNVGATGGRLWEAAARRAASFGAPPLEHLVIDIGGASVAVVEARGRRVMALTGPEPPVGLVLFDLRTCLADAFPAEEPAEAQNEAGVSGETTEAETTGSAPDAGEEAQS